MNQRYSEAQRRQLFEEQQWTGEPLRAVARRLGIHEATAYAWERRKKLDAIKPTPVTAVRFAKVVRAAPSSWLVVEVGRAVIRVPRGFDAEHLFQVVQALNSMKILTYDGSGVVLVHRKLDAGKFELPKATPDQRCRQFRVSWSREQYALLTHMHHHLPSATMSLIEPKHATNRILNAPIWIENKPSIVRPRVTHWHRYPQLTATRLCACRIHQSMSQCR